MDSLLSVEHAKKSEKTKKYERKETKIQKETNKYGKKQRNKWGTKKNKQIRKKETIKWGKNASFFTLFLPIQGNKAAKMQQVY